MLRCVAVRCGGGIGVLLEHNPAGAASIHFASVRIRTVVFGLSNVVM